MAVSWSQSPYADDEPTAPSTQYILVAVGVDPSGPDTVALAYAEVEPTPYAVPDKEQPGVIEPTALYKKTGVIHYELYSG